MQFVASTMDSSVITNLGIEISSQSSSQYEGNTKLWTKAENKVFENALAVFDTDTPHRWERVSEMVPGKTIDDVIKHYEELENDISNIEAGLVPIPGYDNSPFVLVNNHVFDGFNHGKKSSIRQDQERKKGVPWTEHEHRLFLMGLKKYGKGDWRNISRNFVMTRTPTQVASHAQKYFIRQISGGKDKRRASIHDITTVNLPDSARIPSSPENKASPPDLQPYFNPTLPHWNQPLAALQWGDSTVSINMGSTQGNVCMSPYVMHGCPQKGAGFFAPYAGYQSFFRSHPRIQ